MAFGRPCRSEKCPIHMLGDPPQSSLRVLPPVGQLPQPKHIGFLDLAPLLERIRGFLDTGSAPTKSQSAMSALIRLMSLTRSLSTVTAWLGLRVACSDVSQCLESCCNVPAALDTRALRVPFSSHEAESNAWALRIRGDDDAHILQQTI